MDRVRPRSVGPTAGQERHEFLDVLRGFALLGIALANMISLSLFLYLSESERASLRTSSADKVFDFLELVFIETKFYTIFSVLFGIGFSILMTRADAKGMIFRRFFLRRAFFLYLIGVAHGVLFWHNDILQSYAMLGQTFAPVGRMALTNYVGQSAICTLIFRSVGLGLGGTIGPALYLPLGFAIYVVQLIASRAWLSRFQYGPLEWLWRMLTYGTRIPLRKPNQPGLQSARF